MKIDWTATTGADPLNRPDHIQVRLRAVACDDNGTPYRHKDKERSLVQMEHEVIRAAKHAEQLAADVARAWKPKAERYLLMQLSALGIEVPAASKEPKKTFKVTL